ncbi:hypothetical protein WR25_03536 [Diploscapter pachys]|uniref:Uncharacterized protein n=1 Tax=Diploscapter pachys TaxID=2018661 RepID=A0A2A2K4H3_9BILA|nr:hypothetical protein WR25_03536 [Diploscapter pachys]
MRNCPTVELEDLAHGNIMAEDFEDGIIFLRVIKLTKADLNRIASKFAKEEVFYRMPTIEHSALIDGVRHSINLTDELIVKIQDDMLIVGESTELHFDDLSIQNVVRPPTRWHKNPRISDEKINDPFKPVFFKEKVDLEGPAVCFVKDICARLHLPGGMRLFDLAGAEGEMQRNYGIVNRNGGTALRQAQEAWSLPNGSIVYPSAESSIGQEAFALPPPESSTEGSIASTQQLQTFTPPLFESVQSDQMSSMNALRAMQSARTADSSSASYYATSAGRSGRTPSSRNHSSPRQFAWRPRSLPAVTNPFDAHSTVLVQSPTVRSNSNLSTATAISPPPLRPNPNDRHKLQIRAEINGAPWEMTNNITLENLTHVPTQFVLYEMLLDDVCLWRREPSVKRSKSDMLVEVGYPPPVMRQSTYPSHTGLVARPEGRLLLCATAEGF